MAKNFTKTVYREIANEFKGASEDTCVIVFDKEGFYSGHARDMETLKQLTSKGNIRGIYLGSRLRFYDLEMGKKYTDKDIDVASDVNVHDYATEQLQIASGGSIEGLEEELIYGNRLTMALKELIDNKTELNTHLDYIHLDDNSDGRLPMFRSLTIYDDSFELFITGQQMSFMTTVGTVKLHNTSRDIDFKYLVDELSSLFQIDKEGLTEVLSM